MASFIGVLARMENRQSSYFFLKNHQTLLISLLQGRDPFNHSHNDTRIWNSKNKYYSIKEGYERLVQDNFHRQPTWIWKNIWNSDGIPKVNFFCWLLVQRKILTTENMEK